MYFFSNAILFSEDRAREYLLDHYSLRRDSFGFAIKTKDTHTSKDFYSWFHTSREIKKNFNVSLRLMAISHIEPQALYVYGDYRQDTLKQKSEQYITLNPGFNWAWLYFYTKFYSSDLARYESFLGLQLYKEKSLFVSYFTNPKEDTRGVSLSVLTGKNPTLALGIGKESRQTSSDWTVNFGISFELGSYEAGIAYLPQTETNQTENLFFVSKILNESSESLLGEEISPYVDNESLPHRNDSLKENVVKKKERKIYELSIAELIKFRIPLAVAIRIHRASKTKETYLELLKQLSPDLVRKCNKIQFDKARSEK